MQIYELAENIRGLKIIGEGRSEVTSICYDSRKVTPGSLFVALRGSEHDGADYVREALQMGASAIMLSESRPLALESITGQGPVSIIISREPRKDMAVMASRLNGFPSRKLRLVGITGTNGKTTTTYIAESIFKSAGKSSGVIGTISYRAGPSEIMAGQTTPEAVDLQIMFSEMVRDRVEFCLLEVTSHALEMHRILGSSFEVALFTNLSQDHLDFHGDMESYFWAKRKLFQEFRVGTAIINADDPWGKRLTAECTGRKLTFGLSGEADIRAEGVRISMEGVSFTLAYPQGSILLCSSLPGEHNVYNILAASAIALATGIDVAHIQEGVAALDEIPGRFQRVCKGQDFTVIVDFAHTEDALRRLLTAARKLCSGKLIVLFGCGGDRDKGKRPLMGRAAAELSDIGIITSDNPRSEDQMAIIRQIEQGFRSLDERKSKCMIIPGRRDAIREAVSLAGPGDMVVIAGKGHEKYQIIGDLKLPFDDVEEAGESIGVVLLLRGKISGGHR